MHKLFNNFIEKILQSYNCKNILEIGVLEGATTIKILEWCLKNNSKLTSVEPMGWSGNIPKKYKVAYHDYGCIKPRFLSGRINKKLQNLWTVKKELSLNYLKKETNKFEVVIIDGDHNYFTVKNELELLKKNLADNYCIILNDVYGKWSRKDQYCDIRNIPSEFQNPKKQGVMSAIDEFLNRNHGIKVGSLTTADLIINEIKYMRYKNILDKIKGCLRIFRKGSDNFMLDTFYDKYLNTDLKDNIQILKNKKAKNFFVILTNKDYGLGIITNKLEIITKDFV